MRPALLAAAPFCAAVLFTTPALAAWHPSGPPPATELLLQRQLKLAPLYHFAVLLRRESATPAGKRPTMRVIVRAPDGRTARLAAEARQPGYSAIEAVRMTEHPAETGTRGATPQGSSPATAA